MRLILGISLLELVLLLVAPGAVLVRVMLRSSPLETLALAPPISVLLLALAGWVLGAVDARASLVAVLLVIGLILLATGGVAHYLTRRTTWAPALRVPPLYAAGGAMLGAVVSLLTWGAPGRWLLRAPQAWDYLWHQYVLATIARRGLLGPQDMIPIDGHSDLTTIYQFAAHIPAGLASGGDLEGTIAGLNVTMWTTTSLVLPIGVAVLVASWTRDRVAVALAPAVVLLALDYVLGLVGSFPLLVGLGMVPGVLFAAEVYRRDHDGPSAIVLVLVVSGLLIVHPHAFVIAVLIIAAVWFVDLVRHHRGHAPAPRLLGLALCCAAAVIIAAPWLFVAFPGHVNAFHGHPASGAVLREAGFSGHGDVLATLLRGRQFTEHPGDPNPLLGALFVLGPIYLAIRRRHAALLLSFVMFLVMTSITAAEGGAIRRLVGGVWLGDWWRPAAGLALVTSLLIALAAGDAIALLRGASSSRLRVLAAPALLLLLAAGFALRSPTPRESLDALYGPLEATDTVSGTDGQIPAPMLISPLELEAFDELAKVTPDGSRVMNWWADGSPWMFSAHGLVPVQTYGLWSIDPDGARFLQEHLADPGYRNDVIAALLDLRVCSAFVGEGHLTYQTLANRPAWTTTEELPGFEEVYRNAHARVYRVSEPSLAARC
jgi:hypothetical protein